MSRQQSATKAVSVVMHLGPEMITRHERGRRQNRTLPVVGRSSITMQAGSADPHIDA
jgi:hypothetical protein